jgi:ketosteroid isomerase-like protein
MAHPNEELLRKGYDAFANMDIEAIADMFAEDVVWHAYGESPFSGDFKGQQEVFGMFATIPQQTERFTQDIHDVLANDDHAVALVNQTIAVDGREMTFETIHLYHVKDGKVTEGWIIPMDQAKAGAFWAE